jgi:hypothetical protein
MTVLDADTAVQIFTADAVALSTGTSVALSIADDVALSIADAVAICSRVMLSTGALMLGVRLLCGRWGKHSPPTAYNVRVCIVYYYALYVCDFS